MSKTQHRHDISDSLWSVIESKLSGGKGKVGRKAFDNRSLLMEFCGTVGE